MSPAVCRMSLVSIVVAGLACLAATRVPVSPSASPVAAAPPAGVSASDWAAVRAAHAQARHVVTSVAPGRWEARNPGQQWTLAFDGRGMLVTPDAGGWTWGLALEAWGRGGTRTRAVSPRGVRPDGERLAYDWGGGLEEWYVNDGRGVEHGYTLRARPAGAGPVEVSLRVRGGLRPRADANGRNVGFHDRHGALAVRYDGLTVVDAKGRALPAAFTTDGADGLRLTVEDAGATYPLTVDPIAQQAYIKASNTGAGDGFGGSVAIAGDTMVVGAPLEDSAAAGVNGAQGDNSLSSAGAAYVFVRSGSTWVQQAYLKASNTGAGDFFGVSVAIAGDTVVVGAQGEASAAAGVNGAQADNSAVGAGAAYVFVRSGSTWTQQAYLKASNTGADDGFGVSVTIAGDTVVVGASGEDSAAAGVNGAQGDNSLSSAGAAYVFVRSGSTWTQQAYLKASNTGAVDSFGISVTIAGDTVVVGAPPEDSAATGVNGVQGDNSLSSAGAAYVFVRSGSTWTQQAYLKASNTGADDNFGRSLAIAGNTVVVGAFGEASAATGVNGAQADNSAANAGAAYVFVRSGSTWTQQAYLKAFNTGSGDMFGGSVAITGNTIVVGAPFEDSAETGLNGTGADNSAANAGAAYVFVRSGSTWTQQAYLKTSNTGAGDFLGGVAIAGDTIVVGADSEDSAATGVNGGQADNSAGGAGAAYVFRDAVAIAPTAWSAAAIGGAQAVAVTSTLTSTSWTAVSSVPWLTVAPASGQGTGTLIVAASTNTEGAARTGVVTIGDQTLSVTQPAAGVAGGPPLGLLAQQAYAKASNTGVNDNFGSSVAISGDTMVVGAPFEDSAATGVNGAEGDNSLPTAGAAYVFVRNGSTWTQQAYLKASNTGASDNFGRSVAIAGDTIVVGADAEASASTGVNGVQADNSAGGAGAAYVFVRSGSTWTQQAYLKASNTDPSDAFGGAVAIAGDTIVVGAFFEDSAATGVNGAQGDDSTSNAGAAYVFVRSGSTWTQQAYLKASNTGAGDLFGFSVAIAGDTVVVGASGEASASTGVNGAQGDNSAAGAGASYVFVRSGSTWTQQAYLKASNTGADDSFGRSVAIAGDTIVVGAFGEDSAATGVNGAQGDNSAVSAGAAYVFVRSGSTWTSQAYLKASNTDPGDIFGRAVAIAGNTIVVGARGEDSGATGVNGAQADNSAVSAGAAYVFARSGSTWTLQAYLKASNTGADDDFGFSLAVAGDTVVVGASGEASASTGVNGAQGNNNETSAGAAYAFRDSVAIAPTDWTAPAIGGTRAVTVTSTLGTTPWTAVSSTPWLTVVPASAQGSGTLILAASANTEGAARTGVVTVGDQTVSVTQPAAGVAGSPPLGLLAQQAYAKASNTGAGMNFGSPVAVAGDTMVVGAPGEASAATGVNGTQADNSAANAGAAYVFVRNGSTWTQQAYLKASNTGAGDLFGVSVAIAGDTIVVGAEAEDSAATGVNGAQVDNSATNAGAAYVFVRSGGTWTQQAYLKATNTGAGDLFGRSVAIAGDTVVVGAFEEDSVATGVDGVQGDNSTSNAGAAYVFVRSGSTWTPQAYLKASNTGASDLFGVSVGIAGDTIVVGAEAEDSAATGVNGAQVDNSATNAGAAYVFVRSGGTWTQQAYLKATNTGAGDLFGRSVALSGDTVVVGAFEEDSVATGVDGVQGDNSTSNAGAAYVFVRSGSTWTQQAYLKASNTGAGDFFGRSVAIAVDTIVVGAAFEASAATGVNGAQGDNSALSAGAAYVFVRSGSTWSPQAYLKASNTGASDTFGRSVALSGDTIVVGAAFEDSAATGVNGAQADDSAVNAGAVYVFRDSVAIAPTTLSAPALGGTLAVAVTSTLGSTPWTAVSSAPWLTVAPASGQGSGTLTLTAAPSTSTTPRTATVTVAGLVVTVTQPAGRSLLTVAPTTFVAPAAGGSTELALTLAVDLAGGWRAESDAPWLTVSPTRGSGAAVVRLAAMPATAATAGLASLAAPAVVEGSVVVTVSQPGPNGTRTGTITFTPEPLQTQFTRYLAEGATSAFFDTQIALFNPTDTATTATVAFLRAGQPPLTVPVDVPAKTPVTVRPRTIAGLEQAEFSTTVTADVPLVVDRTVTWDGTGYGAHAETAAVAPAPTWYLAEGATHSGFVLFYLLQNPNDTATTVRVRYLRTTGAPLEKDYVLPARSRTNIWVNVEEFPGLGPALEAAELSAVVRSLDAAPIIVERAMYRSNQGRTFNAGHESLGVSTPSTRWFLAEGNTGPFFDQFVLIANPTGTAADVRVTYLLANGTTFTKTMTAPANARSGIWVDFDSIPGVAGFPLADVAVSTTVESTNGVPLVVERAMWWPGDGNTWHEAHNSSGAIETGTAWALAEGEVGGPRNVQTYVLLANTSAYAGRATVTVHFEDGQALAREYALLPQSRTNAAIGPDFGAAVEGKRFAVTVEALGATDGAPVPQLVVERAMYSDAGGVPLAAGTNAVATRLR